MISPVYDIVGVGIGPFNLGLAALASSVPQLSTLFLERRPGFDWHPGMLVEDARLQVPYLADLVTAVDPTSPLSMLSYLKEIGRLYQFVIRDHTFITRKEYNLYCKWAVAKLPSLRFGAEVRSIARDRQSGAYRVTLWDTATAREETVLARAVVVGIGEAPRIPHGVVVGGSRRIFHSSEYMPRRAFAAGQESVTVVGSGQSAAEIFYDLLRGLDAAGQRLAWITRADRHYAMEYSKLTLELSLPDYVNHFHRLPAAKRAEILRRQDGLYKGINGELINAIYDLLYERTIDGELRGVRLGTSSELRAARVDGDLVRMQFHHRELDTGFEHASSALILATGYEQRFPELLAPLEDQMRWDEHRRVVIRRNYEVDGDVPGLFMQNAEAHTHGFTSSDLSLGPYRNAVILNSVLGREHFAIEKRLSFQDFGVPVPEPARRAAPKVERTAAPAAVATPGEP